MEALLFVVADATGQRFASVALGLDGSEISVRGVAPADRFPFASANNLSDRVDRGVQILVARPMRALLRESANVTRIIVMIRCSDEEARLFALSSIPMRVLPAEVSAVGLDCERLDEGCLAAVLRSVSPQIDAACVTAAAKLLSQRINVCSHGATGGS